MNDSYDVTKKLESISQKLGSGYGENVTDKLDKISDQLGSGYRGSVADKLDEMIRLLESIDRKLDGSRY